VQEQVLVGDAADLMDVEGGEVGCVQGGIGGLMEARGEGDVGFVLGDLRWGVGGGHFGFTGPL